MGSGPPPEAIPFIDDSGASSCSSSLLGGEEPQLEGEDDAASLSYLLEDAASRELSLYGLQECDSKGSRSPSSSSPPPSRRTSRSSIKSSDALEDEVGPGVGRGPSLPPPLPPCATCEVSSCCSSSAASSSALSCTTCAVESEPTGGDAPDCRKKPPSVQLGSPPSPEASLNSFDPGGHVEEPPPVVPILSNGGIITNETRTSSPPLTLLYPVPQDVRTPSPTGLANPLIASTPMIEPAPPPHHYISSLRVASMRGAADMGGALVARVATFLRSQYKSSVGAPVIIPWCPRFKLLVSEFETSLVQIPLAPHLKVPPGPASIASILAPQVQMSVNESVVEDRPRRVLVEGEPGYCNANICFRMAYDWATTPPEPYMAGFSLVFVLTLRDFRGGSLFSHLCKEILPRHILSREAMNTLWTHMRKIEEKVLFLLVGFDELCEEEMGDLSDLIEGQAFPCASVVLTSRSGCRKSIPTSLHRRFLITGLNHCQTTTFMQKYFTALGQPDCGSEVMSLVNASQEKYGELPRCPVMCLALGVLYEDFGGKLPSRLTDLFMALIKHMTRKNLQRRGEPMCYGVLPDKYTRLFQEFGKLALEGLKSSSPYFTGSELKTRVQHGAEVVGVGVLLRMRSTSKLNRREYYAPAHISLLEFLAAFYLASLSHSYSQLQVELDALAHALDLTNVATRNSSGIMVVRYLVGILGRNAHLVFNIVSQMGISHRLFFLLLKESGMSQMNVVEVCRHVAGREHVVIPTTSVELEDWGRLLYSPDCSLEGVEVLLDLDDVEGRDGLESFFTSLSFNESVRSVKLTCLVAADFGQAQVTRLVSFVRAVLTKRKLEAFELALTALDDAPAHALAPVVDMVCDTLPAHAHSLEKIVLAMELDGEQVIRLCSVLQSAPQVKVLHLPHLSCGLKGLEAVAQLVQSHPLVSLNLSGALSSGTPIDDRCTWIGGGSPSGGKEDASPLSFWSFVDAKGVSRPVFHSLPRSFYLSIPRRARLQSTLSAADKRDSSLLQKASAFPPPKCSPEQHGSGFHQVLSAFRTEWCRVCHLNLSKCTLSAEDLVCLGETLRLSTCLSSLRLEGLSRAAELLPVLVALQENKVLRLLDLTSSHILLEDAAFQVTLNALNRNTGLRFLVLSGWTFHLESEKCLRDLVTFLGGTELQHLDLTGGRVKVTALEGPLGKLSRQDDVIAVLQEGVPPLNNGSLAFLNLDDFEVNINQVTLRGPQLFFLLRHLPKLVDVSLGSNPGPDVIDDAVAIRIFALLPSAFPCLRRIRIAGWVFSLDHCQKVMRACGRYLKRSQLREVELGGVEVRESSGRADMEHVLVATLAISLHHLSLLSLSGLQLSPQQMSIFGKVLREKLASSELCLSLKGLSYSAVKSLRQSLTEGGRCELLFEGGPTHMYRVRRRDRKEHLLGRWGCIHAIEKFGEEL